MRTSWNLYITVTPDRDDVAFDDCYLLSLSFCLFSLEWYKYNVFGLWKWHDHYIKIALNALCTVLPI